MKKRVSNNAANNINQDVFKVAYPGVHLWIYSTAIQFLHQSTVRLPVPGCKNTHGWHVKKQANHSNDPRSLRIYVTFSCEVIHASMLRRLCGNQCSNISFTSHGYPIPLLTSIHGYFQYKMDHNSSYTLANHLKIRGFRKAHMYISYV